MSPTKRRSAAKTTKRERADDAPPPAEVSVTVAPNVPEEARAQREAEPDAQRGVVIPTPTTDEGRRDG